MPVSEAHLSGPWAAPIALTVILLFFLAVYARGWWLTKQETPDRLSPWSFWAFLSGEAVVWVSWTAWLSEFTHYLLIAHMVQHLLLALAAPPLFLLSCPGVALFRGFSSRPIHDPNAVLQTPGLAWARRLGSWLSHPVTAALLMIVVTISWHIPPIFALAMGSPAVHQVENTSFLATGILFWWPVILPWPSKQHWPRWTVPIYLLGADMPVSVLSAYLAFCGRVVFPVYRTAPRLFGISALNDQVGAAMLMWVAMLFVFLAASVAVMVELLDPPERQRAVSQSTPVAAVEGASVRRLPSQP